MNDLQGLGIGEPILPRFRRPPSKFGGSNQHEFGNPSAYRKQYFEALDLLIQELSDHFQQKDVMQPVLTIEVTDEVSKWRGSNRGVEEF